MQSGVSFHSALRMKLTIFGKWHMSGLVLVWQTAERLVRWLCWHYYSVWHREGKMTKSWVQLGDVSGYFAGWVRKKRCGSWGDFKEWIRRGGSYEKGTTDLRQINHGKVGKVFHAGEGGVVLFWKLLLVTKLEKKGGVCHGLEISSTNIYTHCLVFLTRLWLCLNHLYFQSYLVF